MNTGQIAGGLLSVFGDAGAGAAKGYNAALTKEEDTNIDKSKQKTLSEFKKQLENLRAQNAIKAQEQQQGYEINQKGSGYYSNGKELTQSEFNQLKENQQDIPGLLNTDEHQKKIQQQAIRLFNETHPKPPVNLSFDGKIYHDLIESGMSSQEAAEHIYAMKKRENDDSKNDDSKNDDYLKGTMLEYNRKITYKDIQGLDDRAHKKAEEEIEKLKFRGKQVSEQVRIQIEKAAQAAEYALAGRFRRETLRGGMRAYVHKNADGEVDGLFTLLGEPIRVRR